MRWLVEEKVIKFILFRFPDEFNDLIILKVHS